MGKKPDIVGEEGRTGWLTDASACHALFGLPRVPLDRMVDWVADWIARGMESLNKPTDYDSRDGSF